MKVRFNPGDIVQLKSGGPRMKVVAINDDDSLVSCTWDGDVEQLSAEFRPTVLREAEPESTEHRETPHDALIKALEHVDDMENVLIIYDGDDHSGSFDSGLTVERAVYMCQFFLHWLLSRTNGSE